LIRQAAAIAAALAAASASAQPPQIWADAASEVRERGIGMSGGRAGIEAGIGTGREGPTVDAALLTTRGAPRHGGADLRAMLSGGYTVARGGSRLRGDVTWRGFAGGGGPLDYWEAGALADTLIGPLTIAASLRHAPSQRAIGGNLTYARIGADGGLPGSPWSLAVHLGRSSGTTRDPLCAARLRPEESYLDWAIGVRRVVGPALLSLTYSDTDIGRGNGPQTGTRAQVGAALVARIGLSF